MKVADIIAPKLIINFCRLIRLGSFPECWRSVNIIYRKNYLPISITNILYKVYEKFVSHKLSGFCEKYFLLPAAQFAYRKGLGCNDALHTISHHLQK